MGKYKKIHIRKTDFKELFNQLFPSLCIFANKFVRDEEVAKDLVQDVFTKIWNSATVFESEKSMRTYFYLATKNKCFDYLKSTKNKSLSLDESNVANDVAFSDDRVVNEIIREETYKMLKDCINQLPPRSREILLLNLQGLSNQDIADKLNVSINTIKTQKLIAYRKLRDLFGHQYALWLLVDFYKDFLA